MPHTTGVLYETNKKHYNEYRNTSI